MYKTKVDLRSRKAMTEFLEDHFRYSTMNSWNGSSSYANNVKVWNLDLTEKQRDKFFELIDSEDDEFFSCYVKPLIDSFREDTGYTAGFNGRSGGYLVMYDGEWVTLDYKSRCTMCGQLNYKSVEESNNVCGRCGEPARVNLTKPIRTFKVYAGRSIDADVDWSEYSLDGLRERVKLVQRFDQLCDEIRADLIWYLDSHNLVEEEYTVTKTRKVFQEIA